MNSMRLQLSPAFSQRPLTLRDTIAPLFRYRRVVSCTFFIIIAAALLWALLAPKQYQAEMKLLVKRDRVESAATPGGNDVSEEEINSEVELLQSRDLLEKVVLQCNLETSTKTLSELIHNPFRKKNNIDLQATWDRRVSAAVLALQKHVEVLPVRKTNLVRVTYQASDPRLAARVLEVIASEYLTKHIAVYTTAGASSFFESERQRYRKELDEAALRLSNFDNKEKVAAPQLEKDLTVQHLADFDSSLKTTQVAIAETARRIHKLEVALTNNVDRSTAQIRTSDNGVLLQQLKGTLLSLQLKRTTLMENFKPDYRPVQEVDKQIANTRSAIESAERSPLREETTERDPTHDWLRAELAKAHVELDALKSREGATARVVRSYRGKSLLVDKQEGLQDSLVREKKIVEDNYLLYSRKAEEARISDALGQKRIVNVAIAEAPTVPALPMHSQSVWVLFLGVALAVLASVGLAFAFEYFDPSLRTPDEVQFVLDMPVLAALPEGSAE
jgi:uncharacterized protein involved in exopolysaccharide biosynthesis